MMRNDSSINDYFIKDDFSRHNKTNDYSYFDDSIHDYSSITMSSSIRNNTEYTKNNKYKKIYFDHSDIDERSLL